MTMDRQTAENRLYREARLLDERDFHGWLQMFSQDCLYWLPVVESADELEPSIIRDDRRRMEERVFRLLETPAHAQMPPSRTQHDVTNVEVVSDGDGGVHVRCNLTVHELRPGDPSQVGLASPRLFAGRCHYVFRDEGEWRITLKKVLLLDRDLPQYNLTFLF
jgi:3-phenylpropionate/cinnamic acid dioxygenase small subunit